MKHERHESTKGTKGVPEMGLEFEPMSSSVLEAAVEVHRTLGPGFLEGIYQKALAVALRHRGIVYHREHEVRIVFEGEEVGIHRLDLVVGSQIIVELKAVKAFEEIHFSN
jgi:GxxExxY protein